MRGGWRTRRSRGGGSPSQAPEPRRAELPRHSYRTNMQPTEEPASDDDVREQPKKKATLKRIVIEIDMNFKEDLYMLLLALVLTIVIFWYHSLFGSPYKLYMQMLTSHCPVTADEIVADDE